MRGLLKIIQAVDLRAGAQPCSTGPHVPSPFHSTRHIWEPSQPGEGPFWPVRFFERQGDGQNDFSRPEAVWFWDVSGQLPSGPGVSHQLPGSLGPLRDILPLSSLIPTWLALSALLCTLPGALPLASSSDSPLMTLEAPPLPVLSLQPDLPSAHSCLLLLSTLCLCRIGIAASPANLLFILCSPGQEAGGHL